jgi:hypothetical protein
MPPQRGRPASEESKAKKRGKSYYTPTEEHKEILREYAKNIVYTEERRHNMSVAHKGQIPTNIEKLREINKGRIHTPEENEVHSRYNKEHGVKPPKEALENTILACQKNWGGFISPEGIIYDPVINLRKFCRDHDLCRTCMVRVFKGIHSQHKGWRKYAPS